METSICPTVTMPPLIVLPAVGNPFIWFCSLPEPSFIFQVLPFSVSCSALVPHHPQTCTASCFHWVAGCKRKVQYLIRVLALGALFCFVWRKLFVPLFWIWFKQILGFLRETDNTVMLAIEKKTVMGLLRVGVGEGICKLWDQTTQAGA